MRQTFIEGDLHLNFPKGIAVEKADEEGIKKPTGMMFVDFFIELEDVIYMVEIKDPSDPKATQKERKAFLKKIVSNELISNNLTPKARDSYTFLHLMKRDKKPIVFIVLLGVELFQPQDITPMLTPFKDRLFKKIKKETDKPWEREHISDCIVCTCENWQSLFPEWSLSRTSKKELK